MQEKIDFSDIPETSEEFWDDIEVNKVTEKTFKDTDVGKNLIRCESVDNMFGKLDS